MRGMVKALKSGECMWYAADQDYGKKHSVFAPFFGVNAASVKATPRMVKMAKCDAYAVFVRRSSEGKTITIEFERLPVEWPHGDDVQDCAVVNEAIERGVRQAPAQYMWMHRRFKTRPEGEASFYR